MLKRFSTRLTPGAAATQELGSSADATLCLRRDLGGRAHFIDNIVLSASCPSPRASHETWGLPMLIYQICQKQSGQELSSVVIFAREEASGARGRARRRCR